METKVNRILVKQLRNEKLWTQEKLAEVSNVHPRTIQRVERDGIISTQTCLSLCKALGIKPEELRMNISEDSVGRFGRASQDLFIAVSLAIITVLVIDLFVENFIDSFRTYSQQFAVSWLTISFVAVLAGAALARIAPTQYILCLVTVASFSVLLPFWDGAPFTFTLRITLVEILPLSIGCLGVKWWQYRRPNFPESQKIG